MEGLLSLLLFAGFFFLMMRFGCGAHMAHGGHGNHGKPNKKMDTDLGAEKHLDPVCGMEIDINEGYGKMHEGRLYRFCSRDCLDKFETDTTQYLAAPVKPEKVVS